MPKSNHKEKSHPSRSHEQRVEQLTQKFEAAYQKELQRVPPRPIAMTLDELGPRPAHSVRSE